MNRKASGSRQDRIREITILAMFSAIILAMVFVPYLGLITLFGIPSITLIHIPVLIGGAMLGRKQGAFLGLVFGMGTLIRATYSAGFDYLFIFPWVSVIPRVIFGFLAHDVYRGLLAFFRWMAGKRKAMWLFRQRLTALVFAFAVLTALHTAMVVPMMVFTFPLALGNASIGELVGGDTLSIMEANGGFRGILIFLQSIFITNGAIEILLAASAGAVVADRLIHFREKADSEGGDTDHAGID
ncbi:MAG TPA: ECF transporter S component [Candidatus Izemoplasmatales bacterium]|nr:ECF transporter S component [Candidatus Izemoplasmatales bacterium]